MNTLPDECGNVWSTHRFDLMPMCPVSGNPLDGSYLKISHPPCGQFLEVYSLAEYIQSFIGGKNEGGVFVRDMEQTISVIARHCADTLSTRVVALAHLRIQTPAGIHTQRLRVEVN